MILDALIDALGAVARFILGLFGQLTLPTWVGDLADFIETGVSGLGALAWWLPLEAMTQAFAFLLLCTTVGWTIYAVRTIASYFTGGGGKA